MKIAMPLRNRYFFVADVLLLPLAAYLSFVLRLENVNLLDYAFELTIFSGLALASTVIVLKRAGIYARYWRFASVDELLLLAGSVAVGAVIAGALAIGIDMLLPETVVIPRSVPFIFMLLALTATAGPRLGARLFGPDRRRAALAPAAVARTRVLVMGAGSAGSMMVRELRQNPQQGFEVVGFVDDDPAKRGMRIHSVPVLGDHTSIPELVQRHQIALVIIAMPSASGKVIRQVVSICDQCGVRTKSIPGIYELIDGKVHINQLRDVQIDDLLRRKPIRTNTTAVAELIRGRRVLVTGAGGSIGSELCRQVLRSEPSELILLGHGENSVFTIQNELKSQLPAGTRLEAVIADIRFAERMDAVFSTYRPEIVFHAAAHKHVPLMEMNPIEAITNNVLGTRNLLRAALATGVPHFVMISTDKAVNPTSIMGSSKRAAELLVHQAARRSGRAYLAVRFGNVLGSRGSVVLTFKQQIAAGGPVTVTHPEMRRYFMTIPEAVQLVLQAATLGRGGEVFMLDMGEPVKIIDLARDMIRLSGFEVGRDIDIVFTGIRPGEKLYEDLFVPGETYERTVHEKLFIACNASNFVPAHLDETIALLEMAARRGDQAAVVRTLKQLIPEMLREVEEAPALPVEAALRARAVAG